MKLKNATVYNAKDVIVKLKGMNLPIRISVKLNKTLKAIAEQFDFIEERRVELVKKYGSEKAGEDGKEVFSVDDDKYNDFQKEYAELLQMEEEVDVRTINVEELPDSVELNGYDIDAISFMFEEEKTEE